MTGYRAMFVVPVLSVLQAVCLGGTQLPDGWTPKFYTGLEAVGSVTWEQDAFKGKGGARPA